MARRMVASNDLGGGVRRADASAVVGPDLSAHERPWWEAVYARPDASAFGPVGPDYRMLSGLLPPGARVLDIGCGEGRHALFFADHGCRVTAFDVSHLAIAKLRDTASRRGTDLTAAVADVRTFGFAGRFDLIVAHGMLQLLDRADWLRAIAAMKGCTVPGGWNAVTVVTAATPGTDGESPSSVREGEIAARYTDWEPVDMRSYDHECNHDGVMYTHPMNKVIARRPVTGAAS